MTETKKMLSYDSQSEFIDSYTFRTSNKSIKQLSSSEISSQAWMKTLSEPPKFGHQKHQHKQPIQDFNLVTEIFDDVNNNFSGSCSL
ncbi:hypothetical protein GcC1_214032 [Golovinomyces cichoracearum]|uniref:Uncharacterized protein n=1 Tax=Golovinomyces cichoracearum TaxID=62708 RepID=A0A420H9K9_9PEZI|nr:hypothetical protein GcC1_214032 [Golovinomyces cichoracearum]